MSDERRRGTDPLLQQLFEQNADQHRENRGLLNQMNQALQMLAVKDENHSERIGVLEAWRKEEADPAIEDVKGARWLARGTLAVGGVGGLAGIAAWVKAFILGSLSHP